MSSRTNPKRTRDDNLDDEESSNTKQSNKYLESEVKRLKKELCETIKKLEESEKDREQLRAKLARSNLPTPSDDGSEIQDENMVDDDESVDTGDPWDLRFKQLKDFRREFGDCKVPRSFHRNKQLGIWVKLQKQNYGKMKRGEKSAMTEERASRLESIGIDWGKGYGEPVSWESRLSDLEKYRRIFSHCGIQV